MKKYSYSIAAIVCIGMISLLMTKSVNANRIESSEEIEKIPMGYYELTDTNQSYEEEPQNHIPVGSVEEDFENSISVECDAECESETIGTVSINSCSVNLYALEDWAKEYISLDAEHRDSFQIEVSGAENVTYNITSGSSAQVSSEGLISPKYTTWYWSGGMGSTAPINPGNDRIEIKPNYGESVVKVNADGIIFEVKVNVMNYVTYYADAQIETYIKNNITEEMTDEEKIKQAALMAASYDYNASYYGYTSMIVAGGGDCWASTGLVIEFCKKLGYKAWIRIANQDLGAGSGHRNALVETPDGDVYQVDAGYSGKAPRSYSVKKRTSLFDYRTKADGIEIYQYCAQEMPERFVIPDEIDGKKVVSIGASCFASKKGIKEIVIPDTVTSIGKSAFNTCSELQRIHIPAKVTEVGQFAFCNLNQLTEMTCDSNNAYFCVENGVLYTKNKDTVLACPSQPVVNLPESVTKIGDYAFYYNRNIKKIVLPSKVTTLGEGAFGDCSSLSDVSLNNALQTIGNYCFYDDSKIMEIMIPESVTTIGTYAFAYCGKLTVTIKGNMPACGDEALQEQRIDYQKVFKSTTGIVSYDKNKAGFTKEAMEIAGPDMEWKENSSISDSTVNDSIENDSAGNNQQTDKTNNGGNNSNGTSTFEEIKDAIGNANFTGLCKQNGKVIYIKKGVFQKKYTGFVKHTDKKKYYVKKGVFTKKTGLLKHTNGKMYYAKKGVLQSKYTGFVKHTNKKKYYVKKGLVTKKTGIYKHTNGKYYYAKKGILQSKFSGYVKWKGKKVKVKKGVAMLGKKN